MYERLRFDVTTASFGCVHGDDHDRINSRSSNNNDNNKTVVVAAAVVVSAVISTNRLCTLQLNVLSSNSQLSSYSIGGCRRRLLSIVPYYASRDRNWPARPLASWPFTPSNLRRVPSVNRSLLATPLYFRRRTHGHVGWSAQPLVLHSPANVSVELCIDTNRTRQRVSWWTIVSRTLSFLWLTKIFVSSLLFFIYYATCAAQ